MKLGNRFAVVTGAHTGSKLLTAVSARLVAVSGLLLATAGEAIAAIVGRPVGLVVGHVASPYWLRVSGRTRRDSAGFRRRTVRAASRVARAPVFS